MLCWLAPHPHPCPWPARPSPFLHWHPFGHLAAAVTEVTTARQRPMQAAAGICIQKLQNELLVGGLSVPVEAASIAFSH